MSYMFRGCKSLRSIDLSSFDTTMTTTLEYMFSGCESLEYSDLENFNTSNVINMEYMFNNCSSLININFVSFDTSNVKIMDHMFNGCSKLINVNLSNFNTKSVRNMEYMFSGCSSLKEINVSNLNTTLVINMGHMFENCNSLTSIDISTFNTSNTQNVEYMFANDDKLIFVNADNFDESSIKKIDNMFLNTKENMVFCIKDSSKLLSDIIESKTCTMIDCSEDWIKSRQRIVTQTLQCVEKCPDGFRFFYEYNCVYRCPNNTYPVNFVCKDTLDYRAEDDTCTIRDFFFGYCRQILVNARAKQQFIEKTGTGIVNGDLYDLVVTAIDKKRVFTIYDGNEVYQI